MTERLASNVAIMQANPMLVKQEMASNIVAQYHSQEAAVEAAAHLERTVQRREPKESDHEPVSLAKLRESIELSLGRILWVGKRSKYILVDTQA